MLIRIMLIGFLPIATLNFLSIAHKARSETLFLIEMSYELIGSTAITNIEEDSSHIPDEIISESSAGTVTFPHLYHYEDEGIECVDCHHEMNAQNIDIPHEEYFEDFWIDCNICHADNAQGEIVAHACSDCHNSNPSNIADEMISKKVAIHKNCWECHEVGTGLEASESCEYCHIRE